MNKLVKKGIISAVALATLIGTYTGREKDYPMLYSNKTGTSYGINFSLVTNLQEGSTVNGINLAFKTNNKGGTVNGLNIALLNVSYGGGRTNGLEMGLVNTPADKSDQASELSGLALGIYNDHKNLKGAQLGIYGVSNGHKEKRAGILLNLDYAGNTK